MQLSSSTTHNGKIERKSTLSAHRALPRRTAPRKRTGSDKATLGEVLRARRRELRLTQRELANELGVKPAHVAYLELDRRRPSLKLLSRIAQVLDLKRERLILLSHPEAGKFFPASEENGQRAKKDQAWRDFSSNKAMIARHKITPKELKVLAQVALLGRVTTPRSFLFILNSIRQAVADV
ncbi:MAG TPA: helix-turn-helix transcriptional regulator [Candidatus Binataceae bacterium]|nr:helix-turn-helix transcriptional regulator [Candidatus Binataceae bacterium]